MQILTALLFALLATLIPSDIPIRFEILGPSATYTNTEEMFDALPTESPVTAQEGPQDIYNFHVYLPMGSKPMPDTRITPAQVRNATGAGYSYLEWMTTAAKDQGKRVTHEYPAMPVWLMVDDRGVYMPGLPGATVSWFQVKPAMELATIAFDLDNNGSNDILIWADRVYTQDGPTQYQFTLSLYNSTVNARFLDLFMGNYQIFDNITADTVGHTVTVITDKPQPSHRYTLRHASRLGYNLFSAIDGATLRDGLNNMLTTYGFGVDLYDPIFGIKRNIDPTAYASGAMYRDCEVALPAGALYHVGWVTYYPYSSKVCRLGVGPYITLTRFDYLVPMIQALHVLNATGNPDAKYSVEYALDTTPREIARWVELEAWNGHGIRIWGKDPSIASSVRTDVFLVLETLLGYKYGDSTSKSFADVTAKFVLNSQAGQWIETADDGNVLRPTQRGGQLVAWTFDGAAMRYQMPPRTILTDILDMASMPVEVQGVIATNSESTGLMVQSLRVYGRYALNMNMIGGMMP